MSTGRIFCIMGKSGSGKDSIYKRIMGDGSLSLQRIVPCTTRPIRNGEKNGREYWFYTEKEFHDMEKTGGIIESRCYDTVYGPWYYFTHSVDLSAGDAVMIGTIESFTALKNYYGDGVIVPIYIEVEDGERLQRALSRERGESIPKYRELCRRFLADCDDFSEENILRAGIDRRFSNDDFDRCVEEITEYIKGAGG